MEQHRIETYNAVELYLKDSSRDRAADVILSLARWPFDDRLRNCGKFVAALDALTAKHGPFAKGVVWRFGMWLTRRAVPQSKPTWNDYWLLYWTLTYRDRPDLALAAMRELHHRAWHVLEARTDPAYAYSMDAALWMVKRECTQHPEFRRAMLAEIAHSPCREHPELRGCAPDQNQPGAPS